MSDDSTDMPLDTDIDDVTSTASEAGNGDTGAESPNGAAPADGAEADDAADTVVSDAADPVVDEAADTVVSDAAGAVDAGADGADEAGVPAEGGDVEVVSDEELLLEQPVIDNPFTRPGKWFVVHTQSGYEKKVKQNLEARIHSMNAEEAVYEVVIPMEDYVDFKNGKRIVAQRKMFPGYLLVRAELDDTAWFVIRNTPGVTGFVGQGAKPTPLPKRDVEAFLMPKGTEEQVASRAKPRLEYEIGETVRVREGPFADFSGEVIEINEDQLKLKVLVNIFGRETPVELEFSKVAKL